MKIDLKQISIKDLSNNYRDEGEHGVFGYDGKLDIRPPYQREFVYKDKQREAVIDTITKDFPLNVMYWADNGKNKFEVIDGQQRTISISQYINGDFAYKGMYFHNLPKDKQDKILNYKLFIYICNGDESEKLGWFETINIAGEKLTSQELRNAVYPGSFLSDAKRYFSKNVCAAHQLAGDYLKGSAIRQEYLENVLNWISEGNIKEYMAQHQHDRNAEELWTYFNDVFNWVKKNFFKYRREMKGVEWGKLYNEYKDVKLNPKKLEDQIHKLMGDEEITDNKGVYEYVLSGNERHLNMRTFDSKQKRIMWERQDGICLICETYCDTIAEMHADHIKPWSKNGKTELDNGQMLCKSCNLKKSDK